MRVRVRAGALRVRVSPSLPSAFTREAGKSLCLRQHTWLPGGSGPRPPAHGGAEHSRPSRPLCAGRCYTPGPRGQ